MNLHQDFIAQSTGAVEYTDYTLAWNGSTW